MSRAHRSPRYLPLELIEIILSRLPVKPLKRFRSVAKSWRSLIDDEEFVKTHLQRSLVTNSHHYLLLGSDGRFSVHMDLSKESVRYTTLELPLCCTLSLDYIDCVCNGLALVRSEPPVLWNPFSREHKILHGCWVAPHNALSMILYGFWFDSLNNDYRVLRVVENPFLTSKAETYSLKLNLWRTVDDFPIRWSSSCAYVNANGVLHTLVSGYKEIKLMAFSLDCDNKINCYEVMLPPEKWIGFKNLKLGAIEGCLCLTHFSDSHHVNIWVMKDSSWTKLLSINDFTYVDHKYGVLNPLGFSKDGTKLLLAYQCDKLFWYDLKEEILQKIHVNGLPSPIFPQLCVESLVSLLK